MFYRYNTGQIMTADGDVVSQLNISLLRVDDGGLFSCIAHHGEMSIAHSDRLNVYGMSLGIFTRLFMFKYC